MASRWRGLRAELLLAVAPAMACEVEGGGASASAEAEAGPPPGGLTLALWGPLYAGAEVSLVVRGAAPGSRVFVGAGWAQAAGPCLPGLGGLCLDISGELGVLGSAVANGAGRASVDVLLPHDLPEGTALYLQPVQASPPVAGGVMATSVEYPYRVCGDWPWADEDTLFWYPQVFVCGPLPARGACPDVATFTTAQSDWLYEYVSGQPSRPFPLYYDTVIVDCFESTVEDACCYRGQYAGTTPGRPFEVGGSARLAGVVDADGWCADRHHTGDGLSRGARRRLAWAWTQQARGEHASVASFARFTLQLLQVGAPAELVAAAAAAMADEVRHARQAFAVASALAGRAVAAGPLEVEGAVGTWSLESIVRSVVREGCVGETIAAAQARAAAEACEVESLREVLTEVADDEARHAALAWRFVAWAVQRAPGLAEVLRAEVALASAPAHVEEDRFEEELRAWGQLSAARRAAVARDVLTDVVRPCAEVVLRGRTFPVAA